MYIKLFLLISMVILSSCKEMKDVNVTKINSFNIKTINSDKIEAELSLQIKNSNSFGFAIYPSNFEVIFSGIKLGKAQLNKKVHIKGNSENSYHFILNTKLTDLKPLDIFKLLNGSNAGKIEIKGDLKIGKFYFLKKIPIDYIDKIK